MGRWRPPQQPGSLYVTGDGMRRLQEEQNALWLRRREVVKALSAAAAEGDRSENAEYIYRKKELREIDRRIRYLQKRLPDLKVVESAPTDRDKAFFGAWVEVEDEAGDSKRFRIVGPDEFDHETAYISMDSPMARAVLGKALDDEITVPLPGGAKTFFIIDIEYAS